jgi:hypothetical protein
LLGFCVSLNFFSESLKISFSYSSTKLFHFAKSDGYIALYGTDYVATVDNDPSFPTRLHHRYIADIKSTIRTEHIGDPFTLYSLKAEIVGGVEMTQRNIHGHPIQAFNATISDGTEEIEHPFIDPFGLLFNMNGIQNRYTPPQLSS